MNALGYRAAALALLSLLAAHAACLPFPLSQSGPQDKGGIELVIAVKADASNLEESVLETAAVIERRCARLEAYCMPRRAGGDPPNRLVLRVSSPLETTRVKSILLAEGLELRPVVSRPSPHPLESYRTRAEAEAAAPPESEVLPFVEEGFGTQFLVVERTPVVGGPDVRALKATAYAREEDDKDYLINFTLRAEGARRLKEWTGANINRYLAVVLNGEVRSAPNVKSEISDSGQISGAFTKEQAEDVARILMTGNLPAPVELLEERTYKP